jgi:WD40 repeat protein
VALCPGTRLGAYEVVDLLGAGGMGEVWRARDTRLGREVAVKVLHEDASRDAGRLKRFEIEARAVASLNHPHVLTVHDVGTHEGSPYVVTELLEGESLREVITRRSPTLHQVLGWAVQAAQGLAAAHHKGIVHRDLKPENLFLTTDGRIKILDFGLAKQAAGPAFDAEAATESSPTQPGLLMGTLPYMSPEQVEGQPVDARSDLFSFGVVLYELISRRHPFRRDTLSATVGAILHETPLPLVTLDATIPRAVDGIVRRCLERRREERFETAHDLGLALEAVLQAPTGSVVLEEVEERSPYPGLSSFTEKDAAVFFGREAEVEALWEKVQHKRLLAVIGPSGAGKTSFLRAGVIPSRPDGWGAVHATPGANPGLGLAHALTPELAGDPEAMRDLIDGVTELTQTGGPDRVVSAAKRWKTRHAEVLVVVDQLEELFTLNPAVTQARFAALLARLAADAGVHVVLSLRDDFLLRCFEQEPLAPSVTPLTIMLPLKREALRRALVEPARKRGYRFEDEALVEEMVESVEGARAALPLLAFAVARLWERRDRERKLLTRAAYEEIGGVAGALAQHAEATMDRIGPERQGLVREIFRNLVTAHGTRAVVDREELLSAFPGRAATEEALRQLIDARLVTSYEVEAKEGEASHHRIEVVHESLLTAWPRLVRWQAQDEEGALLRDQLKQAAHLWEEKGRTSDLLWTGTAYREFELWRERYPGALTALEEGFARAMTDKARRRKRLLTAAVASVIVALAGIAIVIGILHRQTERARDRAEAEALRAEAGKLLALGQAEIDRYPTAALAYARKSLELADTPEARRFAVEVLWRGPVARFLPVDRMAQQMGIPSGFERIAFSPDGRWLAAMSPDNRILLLPRDGGPPRYLPTAVKGSTWALDFGPQSDLLVANGPGGSLRILSVPDLREVHRLALGGLTTGSTSTSSVGSAGWVQGGRLWTYTRMSEDGSRLLIRTWPIPEGPPQVVTRLAVKGSFALDPMARWLAYGRGRTLILRTLGGSGPPRERALGQLQDDFADASFMNGGDRLVSFDKSGEIRLWSPTRAGPMRVLEATSGTLGKIFGVAAEWEGQRLAVGGESLSIHSWDLRDPPDAEPVVLRRPDPRAGMWLAFDPSGPWLAMNNAYAVALWPLSSPSSRPLRGQKGASLRLRFSPDSRWLVSCPEPQARLWPLNPSDAGMRTLAGTSCFGLAIHPAGTHVLVGSFGGGAALYPITGGHPRALPTGWEGAVMGTVATTFDTSGRWAAAAPFDDHALREPELNALRVWDLKTGEARTFSVAHLTKTGFWNLCFAPDGSLFAAGEGVVRRLVLPRGGDGTVSSETIYPTDGPAGGAEIDLSRDGRVLLVMGTRSPFPQVNEDLVVFDLAAHTSSRITTHGQRLQHIALDASGRVIVSGDADGVVRVGPVTGEEPHLLLGHGGPIQAVAVSPDGRWVASVSDHVRLWPMPDMTKPPLHTLPHDELMARLDTLTNLRVVPDPSSATGWKLDVGPFPGWKDVPTW